LTSLAITVNKYVKEVQLQLNGRLVLSSEYLHKLEFSSYYGNKSQTENV